MLYSPYQNLIVLGASGAAWHGDFPTRSACGCRPVLGVSTLHSYGIPGSTSRVFAVAGSRRHTLRGKYVAPSAGWSSPRSPLPAPGWNYNCAANIFRGFATCLFERAILSGGRVWNRFGRALITKGPKPYPKQHPNSAGAYWGEVLGFCSGNTTRTGPKPVFPR